MSTEQTDSHNDRQIRIYQAFDEAVESYIDGKVVYDYIEDVLTGLIEDESVDANTFNKCQTLWEETKAAEQENAKENYQLRQPQ